VTRRNIIWNCVKAAHHELRPNDEAGEEIIQSDKNLEKETKKAGE
jgi:hypothetical protein